MADEVRYTTTSDGVRIAYAVTGEGPPLVFAGNYWGDVHMYSGRRPFWGRATDGLVERGWRVVLYDGRGTGSSERSASDFSLEGRLRDLEAVSDATRADHFTLCGNRQGGPIAIAYSVRHP